MDSHHYYMSQNNYSNGQSASKVYINPNFHRNMVPLNGSMHINPQFSQHGNVLPNNKSKAKIYVNPNFVKTNVSVPKECSQYSVPIQTTSNEHTVNVSKSTVSSSNLLYLSNNVPNMSVQQGITKCITEQIQVAKSRYSIVRQNNVIRAVETTPMEKFVTKLKISKYKMVSVDHLKKNRSDNVIRTVETLPMEKFVTKLKISKYKMVSVDHLKKNRTDKCVIKSATSLTPQEQVSERKKKLIRPEVFQNRFKLVKKVPSTFPTKMEVKTTMKRRQSLNTSRVLLRSTPKVKIRINKLIFKKNNMPCSLFRKYGKCLRAAQGKCEFLHDKKHIAICRKFLKGVCQDKNCLLSHEVTAEKMPTCSFYLKGMCTKESCPYLHIKLNDKTMICADFLKGYCEKGDKCLKRHINVCPDIAIKGICSRKQCPYPHGTSKKQIIVQKNKVKANSTLLSLKNKKTKHEETIKEDRNLFAEEKSCGQKEDKDCRYYKEVVVEEISPEINTIKPKRCKLGDLPSFIEL